MGLIFYQTASTYNFLLGATGTGKSTLALQLGQRLGGEIVSAVLVTILVLCWLQLQVTHAYILLVIFESKIFPIQFCPQ